MQDVKLSLEALRNAVDGIEKCKHRERMLGHVLTFARLLRTDAVLSKAIRDLANDALALDAAKLEAIETGLLQSGDHAFRYLSKAYNEPVEAWRRLVDENPQKVVIASTGETLQAFFRRVRFIGGGVDHAPNAGASDLAAFAETARGMLSIGQYGTLPEVRPLLETLVRVGEACRRLHDFKVLCATGSVSRIATRLNALLDRWDALLRDGPEKADNWIVPDTNGIEHDAATLASRIELFLNGRRSQRLVLFRAKVYFEHFFYDEARAVIENEEKRVEAAQQQGGKPKAQRELEIRRHLDRFIFQEGYFPITEASARRGNLDLLLDSAEQAAIRPLVAEVKQAVRIKPDNIGHDDVQKAVAAARAEIPQYVGHLRARVAWQNIEPIVVVFHTSVENVTDLEDEDVVLIDIGTKSPSKVKPVEPEPQTQTP